MKVVLLKRRRFSDDDDDVVTRPNFALNVVINSVVLSPISISITPTTSAKYVYYYNTYQRKREREREREREKKKQTEFPFFIVQSSSFLLKFHRQSRESAFRFADFCFFPSFFYSQKF